MADGGDLALVDMSAEPSTTSAIINVYTTNLQDLAVDYSSFALPVNVYSCSATDVTATSGCNTWAIVPSAASYVTNTNGSYAINLTGGYFYDITVDSGGEYYCVSTQNASDLAPDFFVTAQLT
ncbi:MAG: hypothetical protein ACYCTE_12045 [Acidimicrobiales bacterium]